MYLNNWRESEDQCDNECKVLQSAPQSKFLKQGTYEEARIGQVPEMIPSLHSESTTGQTNKKLRRELPIANLHQCKQKKKASKTKRVCVSV